MSAGAPPLGARVEAPPATWLPLAAALVTVALWASAFVGIRAAATSFSPGALALGRLALGSVLLGGLLLARGGSRPARRDLGLLLIAGLLWFGLYNVVLNEAERSVDAGTASMLIMIAPILIVALAAAFLKERTTPALLLGGAVAFAGVVVIGLATSSGSASLSGVVLCVVAALASAIGLVAQKPVLARHTALQVTWMCVTIGAVVCLPFAPTLVRELNDAPAGGVAWLVFLGAFPTSGGVHHVGIRPRTRHRRADGRDYLPHPPDHDRPELVDFRGGPRRRGRAWRGVVPRWRLHHSPAIRRARDGP